MLDHHAILDLPDRPRLAFSRPRATLLATRLDQVVECVDAADRAARDGAWVVGYVGYEAAPAFDDVAVVRPGARLPLAWFGVFDAPDREAPAPAGPGRTGSWTPSADRDAHDAAIGAIRDGIARGDVYQVNHTLRLRATWEGDDLALYDRVLRAQGRARGTYLRFGRHRILCASPELFFERAGEEVLTRPMKGTRPRGRWPQEDDALAGELLGSEKDRAENLMIVDLLRNDLGRVARVGSVDVRRLFQVERYPTVLQLTSTIAAAVPRETPLSDLFRALFPCGSVTGAPKLAAMRFIARLEDSPREAYCGAIGVIEPGGDCAFSVAIRTLVLDAADGTAEYGVGGGVTWDSSAEGEYDEALAKAAVLDHALPDFRLLETMRLEEGRVVRLDGHLARLTASARYFGFHLEPDRIAAAILAARSETPAGRHRLRLLVSRDGAVELGSAVLAPLPDEPRRVALSRAAVDPRDVLLYHKTTARATHEAAAAARPDFFDVLLHDGRGRVTEFTRANLLVEIDGELLTPPRACGLLAGVYRAELLRRGNVRERVLTVDDVRRASGIWWINSLRGRVAVILEEA